MAVKFTKRYFSEAERLYDTALGTSKRFNTDEYNQLKSKDPDLALTYSYLHAGLSDKDTSNFDDTYYNMLSAEDKITYLNNEYYTDKTETAVDETTGETFNVYDRTKEYLDYKFQEGVDKAYFESLSGFEKAMGTIGGVLGNAVNALYSTVEGVIDATLLLSSWIANIGDGKVGVDTEASKRIKGWIGEDLTGTRAFGEHLQQFAKRNTYIDKNAVAKTINDVASGLAQMVPLAIPGAGQAIYFTGMAGNTAGQAIYENPDINTWTLAGYTLGTTAIEFATEKLSAVLFGGSSIDKWFGGKSGTGNGFSRFIKSFVSEGFEESVSEFTGVILHDTLVSGNTFTKAVGNISIKDVLYAGLIGGIIGGIGTVVEIGTAQNITITKDGTMLTNNEVKQLKAEGKSVDGKKYSKAQSLNLMETLKQAEDIASKTDSNVNKLLTKYETNDRTLLEKEHKKEYDRAVEKDRKIAEKKADAASALAKILDVVGLEGFQKATDLANAVIETRAAEADKYINTLTGKNIQFKSIEERYKAKNPGIGIKITGNIDSARKQLQNFFKFNYGMDVYFADLGWKDGNVDYKSLTLDENTIIIDNTTFNTLSRQALIETVVKEELVHALQFESGVLSPKNMYNLMKIVQELGGKDVIPAELDAAYDADGKVERLAEKQAQALAQTLLFDELTVSKIFSADKPSFANVYKFLNKNKDDLQNKTRNKKETVKYREVLKRMKMYRDAAIKNIGNAEDVQALTTLLGLTEEQARLLSATYDRNFDTAHYSVIKDSYSVNVTKRTLAQEFLLKQRIDLTNNYAIKDPTTMNNALYRGIFDPDRYTKEARDAIFAINPPENMERMSETELREAFKYNLQDYLLTNYNVTANQEMGCLLNSFNLKDALNDDFIEDMRALSVEDPNAIDNYTTLGSIFDEAFLRKFVDVDGKNPLADVQIQITHTESDSRKKAGYNATKKIITLNIPPMDTTSNAVIYDRLLHEVHHALADIQGLPAGTSPERVKGALHNVSDAEILKLAKMLITNASVEEFKAEPTILRDYVAYGVYRITDGEYMAEAYATSSSRWNDYEKRLKGNVAFNRSGFRVYGNGTVLQGYGRFKNYRFESTQLMDIRSKIESKKLLDPKFVVAYAKENKLVTTLKAHGIDFKTANISDKFKHTINNFTKQDVFDDLFTNDIVGKNATPEERTKIINAVTDYLSSINDAFAALNATKIDWSKWSLTLKMEIADITKERLYSLISQDAIADKTATKQEKEELTNAIIDYVRDGKNQHMRTLTDLENATSLGLAYLELYEKYVAPKDADKNKPHTYEEIKTAVDSLIYKPEVEAAVIKIYSKVTNKEVNNARNRILKQKLLKSDFDYSLAAYHKLMAEMSQGLKSNTEVSDEITKDTGSDEKKISITDTMQVKSFNQEGSYDMETSESQQTDEKLTKKAIKNVKDKIEALQNSPKIFELRNSFEKTQKDTFIKLYGQQAYEAVLKMMPKKSNLDAKVKNIREKIEQSTLSDVTKQQLLTRDTTEFGLTQYNEYIEEMQNALDIAPKEKFVPKKPTVKKAPTKKKTPVAEQKTEIVEKKKATPTDASEQTTTPTETVVEEKTKQVVEKKKETTEEKTTEITAESPVTAVESDETVHQIIESEKIKTIKNKLFEILPPEKLSEFQGEVETPEWIEVSQKVINENLDIFETISGRDYQALRKILLFTDTLQSSAALVMLNRYCYSERNQEQFKDISDFSQYIGKIYQRDISSGASTMAGASAIYGKHNIERFMAEIEVRHGIKLQIPEQIILNAFESKDITSLLKSLDEKIQTLKTQIKNEKDPVIKMDLTIQKDNYNDIYNAIADGEFTAALDSLVQQLAVIDENVVTNQEKIQKIYDDIIEYLVTHTEIKENGTPVFGKKVSILAPKAQEKLVNFLAGMNSFRYLAMLSSPKTGFKNALSNTFICGLALAEDFVTSKLENTQILQQESQVKFTGNYDTEFKNYVKNKYKPYIDSVTSGNKYTTSEMDKLRQQYAEAKDPLSKSKILSAIKKGEQKILNDKPWTSPRSLRNLTNMLAGAQHVLLTHSTSILMTKYMRGKKLNDVSIAELVNKIAETNVPLAKMFADAQKGSQLATLQLAETLKLDLLDVNNDNSIINIALYRANKLLFKTDTKLSKLIAGLKNSAPLTAAVISTIVPFVRTTINTTAYVISRSPIGVAKGVINLLQTRNLYINDMRKIMSDFYKRKYIEMASKQNNKFKFNQEQYIKWLKNNLDEATLNAINGDNKQIKQIYEKMENAGLVPRGLVGASNPYARATAMEHLSQGVTGSAVMLLGIILGAALDAFGYDEDDYLGPIIKIGDWKIGINDLSPFSTMFAMGAMLTSKQVTDKWGAAFDVFVESTIFSTLDSVIKYNDNTSSFVGNHLINTISQFIPAFTKNTSKVFYNAKKNKSVNTGNWFIDWWGKLFSTLAANTIILNWAVPNQINPYTGEPEKYYEGGFFEGVFNNLLPFSFRVEKKSEIEQTAEQLNTKTTGLSGRFTINDTDYNLSSKDKEIYAKYRADQIQSLYDQYKSGSTKITVKTSSGDYKTTTWDKLTNAEKKSALESLYSKATANTKINYWLSQGNYYYTSNKDEYYRLREQFNNSQKIQYRKNWKTSKFVEK